MTAVVFSVICWVLSAAFLVISILQFLEKGFLFHNAYIWASREQRQQMDKTANYRQSGVAFGICSGVFLLMGLEVRLMTGWLWLAVGILAAALGVYAIASSREVS